MTSEWTAWRLVAERRGAAFEETAPALAGYRTPTIDCEVDGARVFVDTDRVIDQYPSTLTRARAQFTLGCGPQFYVHRPHLWHRLNSEIRSPDLTLGIDPAFDERFVVQCPALSPVLELWTPQRMRTLCERFADSAVASDGYTVTVAVRRIEDEARAIDHLIDFAADLARHPRRASDALGGLPGGNYTAPSGSWDRRSLPQTVVHLPAPVILGPRGTCMAAWRHAPEVDDEDLAAGHEAAAYVAGVGEHSLTREDGWLVLSWPRMDVSGGQLLAGARLLASLGRRQTGPYR